MRRAAKASSGLARVCVLAAMGMMVPPAIQAEDVFQFKYTNLNTNFFDNTLFASRQSATAGDVTRLDGATANAHFDFSSYAIGFGAFDLTLQVSNVTPSTASCTGSLFIYDVTGDHWAASVTGMWTLNGSTADLTATVSSVQPIVCEGDAVFDGTTGSFPMAFSEPAPYSGQLTASVLIGSSENWFSQGRFFNKLMSANGQVVAGGTGTAAPEVQITAWRSVRTHRLVGAMAICLDPAKTGNGVDGPTVESRSGGIQRVEVTFDGPVTLTATPVAGISIVGHTTTYAASSAFLGPPVNYSPASVTLVGTNTVAINFPPGLLPDDSCYAIAINPGAINQIFAGDSDCSVRSEYADANGDGCLNLSDAIMTLTRNSNCVILDPRFDSDLSGTINIVDAVSSKSRITTPAHQALCP